MLNVLYVFGGNVVRYGLLPALLLAVSMGFAQTTYYIAGTGNDTNDGQSTATPFRSLNRVNAIDLKAGDAVLFRRGDTFRGRLEIRQSGTAEKPIRFDAYGTGNKPVLAGSMPVSNWTQTGTNLWQASCASCGNQVTGLYRDGLTQPLGRFPNADAANRGNLLVQTHVGTSQLTSGQPLLTDWTGAEVVLSPTYWIIDRATITRQEGNTLSLKNTSTYSLTDGWGFFIQNHPATLDQAGEWYYNPTAKTILLYSPTNPNTQTITATAFDETLRLENAANSTIQNLTITQARHTNLYARNVTNLRLLGNDITSAGEDGVRIEGTGSNVLIERNLLRDLNNNGFFVGSYQNVIFRGNTIRHVGLLPGQGKNGDGQFTSFQSFADQNTVIENNVIDSVGYIGLSVYSNTTIRQNVVSNFCMVKGDGGGIYLWNGSLLPMKNILIQSNIIQKGIGTFGGFLSTTLSGAHGVFLDDCVENVTLSDNTILDCHGLGIYLHAVSHINLIGNTCFNNSVSQLILYNYDAPCQPRSNILKKNILLAKTATQAVAGYISNAHDLASFGLMERNYYARPFNDISTIRAVYNRNVVQDLSLSQWQAQFGQDLTSKSSPITYKEYVLKSMNKINRLGVSTSPSGDWSTWSLYNNGEAKWRPGVPGSQPESGSLSVGFSAPSGHTDSYLLVYKGVQSVVKSKSYLLRFEGLASADKKVVVFIRQRQSPYQDLSRRYEFMVGTARKSYEFALTALADEADALLTFQLTENEQPVQLDNIRLQEAAIEPVNPDALIRVVYNPTTTDSVLTLSNVYRDVKNRYYARQTTLKPYSSVILLQDSLPPVDVSLALKASRTALKVGDVVSLSLTLHSESAGKSAVFNRVQWTYRLPANLTLLNQTGMVRTDSILTGTVQRLATDTTIVFQVKATAAGRYELAAEVTATTSADPDSTPDSGMDDGEDDQARLTVFVRELTPADTARIITAVEPAILPSTVYPNPTTDSFTFAAEADIQTVRVTDMLGRERLTLSTIRRGQTVLFGQQLPGGLYILTITYATGELRTVKLWKLGN